MRVLIVDDSKAMRMIIKRSLKQAGYGDCEVEEAENGRQALEMIEGSAPDLVLTDWNMPEMSGVELLTHVQEMPRPVKIGMITSQSAPEMRAQAKEAGAAFLLTKPFTPDTLRSAVEGVIG